MYRGKKKKTIRGNNQNDGKMISMLINSAARLQKGLATRAKLNKSPAERGDKNAKTQNLKRLRMGTGMGLTLTPNSDSSSDPDSFSLGPFIIFRAVMSWAGTKKDPTTT